MKRIKHSHLLPAIVIAMLMVSLSVHPAMAEDSPADTPATPDTSYGFPGFTGFDNSSTIPSPMGDQPSYSGFNFYDDNGRPPPTDGGQYGIDPTVGTFQPLGTACLNALKACQTACENSGDFGACLTTNSDCQMMNSSQCVDLLNAPPPQADK